MALVAHGAKLRIRTSHGFVRTASVAASTLKWFELDDQRNHRTDLLVAGEHEISSTPSIKSEGPQGYSMVNVMESVSVFAAPSVTVNVIACVPAVSV